MRVAVAVCVGAAESLRPLLLVLAAVSLPPPLPCVPCRSPRGSFWRGVDECAGPSRVKASALTNRLEATDSVAGMLPSDQTRHPLALIDAEFERARPRFVERRESLRSLRAARRLLTCPSRIPSTRRIRRTVAHASPPRGRRGVPMQFDWMIDTRIHEGAQLQLSQTRRPQQSRNLMLSAQRTPGPLSWLPLDAFRRCAGRAPRLLPPSCLPLRPLLACTPIAPAPAFVCRPCGPEFVAL